MILELDGVRKTFGRNRALEALSLSVKETHCLVIIGPSGGGKSTLLRIIGGLEAPDRGTVRLNGERLDFREESLRKHRCTIGTVFQAFNLFPHLNALENISLPLERVHRFPRDEAESRARAELERFQLLSHAMKKPAELSGGQRQRVAIARALSIRPQLLVFDEPTSALDPEMTAEVLEVIAELRRERRDLIMVTHHMPFARRVADQVVFLADGKIIESGDAARIFDAPVEPETASFLAKVLRF